LKKPISKAGELLVHYANGPAQLEAALADLKRADLDIALDDVSWTVRQIVHHVVDGDDVWKYCIKLALGNSDPIFDLRWYLVKPQIQWAELWAYQDRDIDPSLALFTANRKHIVQLIQAIEGSWERTTLIQLIDKQDIVTVGWVVEMQCNHVKGHIEDIRRIRQIHSPQNTVKS
jgi:hypothetical protein